MPEAAELRASAGDLVDRFLTLDPRPAGIFVPNDYMTALCYGALRDRGIEPMRDVDVISCNNEPAYQLLMSPAPATIDIGAERTGRACVEQLIREIRRPGEGGRVQVTISLMLIEPAGPARREAWEPAEMV